ncbi:hypothetical protein J6590_027748 [Homalodisca vitripennis]|nr:hypothetical protein J6590_027748 [Homalodisca vitripennis]
MKLEITMITIWPKSGGQVEIEVRGNGDVVSGRTGLGTARSVFNSSHSLLRTVCLSPGRRPDISPSPGRAFINCSHGDLSQARVVRLRTFGFTLERRLLYVGYA